MRVLALYILACGCGSLSADVQEVTTLDSQGDVTQPSAHPLDDTLRLHQVQALGTHNSYHLRPNRVWDPSHDYEHAPLDVQLNDLGVRQLEIDVHLRVDGELEVFHLPLVDAETSCQRFVDCLEVIKVWSDAHPSHLPILVWVEPKDDIDFAEPSYRSLEGELNRVDIEILSVFPREQVIIPDDIRGGRSSLSDAVVVDGWPTLGQMRGKVLFALLDSGKHRESYLIGAENLAEKVLFVDSDSTEQPFAAMFKIDNAPAERDRIQALAAAGFIVTSNVDSVGEDDASNRARFEASLDAGAHFLSTNWPGPSQKGAYFAEIPGGMPARCHPITAPAVCTAAAIEALP